MCYLIFVLFNILISGLTSYRLFLNFKKDKKNSQDKYLELLSRKIEDLKINILSLSNIQISLEEKVNNTQIDQQSNIDISDKYIEQLHTKISELEVTLQNVVNKM